MGAWGVPVNLAAMLFGLGAIVDMVWPRAPHDPWYSNYAMLIGSGAILGSGLLYMMIAKPYDRGVAPAGDAHLLSSSALRNTTFRTGFFG